MHRTTYEECGHTIEREGEVPPEICPECPPEPQTWQERLESIRKDIDWFAIEAIRDESHESAAAFAKVSITINDCIEALSSDGLTDAKYDRKPDAPL